MAARNVIRSIRKGSANWNEEDRLQLVTLLIKAGYTARINYRTTPETEGKTKVNKEYIVEYWEDEA